MGSSYSLIKINIASGWKLEEILRKLILENSRLYSYHDDWLSLFACQYNKYSSKSIKHLLKGNRIGGYAKLRHNIK